MTPRHPPAHQPSPKPGIGFYILIVLLLGYCSPGILFLGGLTLSKIPISFHRHQSQFNEVVTQIQSGELTHGGHRSRIILPKPYQKLSRMGEVQVSNIEGRFMVYFMVATFQFGDSAMYYVYCTETELPQAQTKTCDQQFLKGDNQLAPHWYKVIY